MLENCYYQWYIQISEISVSHFRRVRIRDGFLTHLFLIAVVRLCDYDYYIATLLHSRFFEEGSD